MYTNLRIRYKEFQTPFLKYVLTSSSLNLILFLEFMKAKLYV